MEDPKTANYLTAGQYAHEFRAALPIKAIDLDEARTNPARMFRRIDQDRVLNYWIAMEADTDFGAIVVFDNGSDKYTLVTGLHRIEAAILAKKPALDAYVVAEANEYRRDLLIRSINTLEGSGPDMHERLAQARELMRLYPASAVKDLAAAFYVKETAIYASIKQADAEARASRLGVGDVFCAMSHGSKMAFDRIQNDNNFVRAVAFASDNKMRGHEAETFARDVQAARTEVAGRHVIEEKAQEFADRDRRAAGKFGRAPQATSTRFLSRLGIILRLGTVAQLGLSGIVPEKLASAVSTVEQAIDLLQRALKVIKKRQDDEARTKTWQNARHGGQSSGPASPLN